MMIFKLCTPTKIHIDLLHFSVPFLDFSACLFLGYAKKVPNYKGFLCTYHAINMHQNKNRAFKKLGCKNANYENSCSMMSRPVIQGCRFESCGKITFLHRLF